MLENRPSIYGPWIEGFSPVKEKDTVVIRRLDDRSRTYFMTISRGPSECGYDVTLAEPVTVRKGYTVLGVTREVLAMPEFMSAVVVCKSTWARLGVKVNSAAAKVDPGFRGAVTLEISYDPLWEGEEPRGLPALTIPAGVGIGTLVFTGVAQAVSYSGKYGGPHVQGAL